MSNPQERPFNALEFELLGDKFAHSNQFGQALECYLNSRNIDKARPEIYEKLGKAYIKLKEYKEAERAFSVLLDSKKASAEAIILHAKSILMQGYTERAKAILDEVMQQDLSPEDNYMLQQTYLTLASEMGDGDKVAELAEQILAFNPNNYPALLTLFFHKKPTDLGADFLDKYVKIADKIKGVNNFDEDLFFALAKAFEKMKDYKKAAKYAKRGNAIYGHRFKFDFTDRERVVNQSIEVFTKEFFEKRKGFGDQESRPIFIVGLPRSATSLTEQILASHSQVTGCGELYMIGNFTHLYQELLKSEEPYPNNIVNADNDQIMQLVAEYYKDISEKSQTPIEGIISDKMPTNFFYVGLIALLFPKARIINCVRDFRDVALSNYMQKFNTGNYWAQSMDDLTTLTSLYKKIMTHWKEVSPIEIYDFNYEKLLEDTEGEARKLVEYCNLDWEDNCLEYYKTKRAVQTASMSQVNKPIFKSSLGKWKNYEPFFGKELKKLGELN